MDEKTSPFNVSPIFHSILFAYQKGLADLAHTRYTTLVNQYMLPYLDSLFAKTDLGRIVTKDVETTLKNLADLLVSSEMVKDVSVEKMEKGFKFVVRECSFAEPTHDLLEPQDVTCPLGILATYLAEKCVGMSVRKTLSEFTSTDSSTMVEFEIKLSWL